MTFQADNPSNQHLAAPLRARGLRRDASPGLLLAALAVLILAVLTCGAGSASAQPPSPQFWQRCDADEPAGQQCRIPAGIAVNPVNGHLYVADQSHNRVVEFTAWGEFLRAFGWGVTASGPGDDPRNEVQQLTVDATGGDFHLSVNQDTTAAIPFDASAATVQSALEGLSDSVVVDAGDTATAPGDFAVSGPAGGPWVIEYTGANADADTRQLQVTGSTLVGGAATATVTTTQPGAHFEVCVPSAGDVCRSGQSGPQPGQFDAPQGLAVDSAGAVYVVDSTNRRVQKFSAAGQFQLMFGGAVNQGGGTPANPGDICTVAHLAAGDTCGAGTEGTAPGQFGVWVDSGSFIAITSDDKLYVGDQARIQRFDTAGAYQSEISVPGERIQSLAADPSGDLYATYSSSFAGHTDADTEPGVHKLSPAGADLGTVAVTKPSALATSPAGDLYVVDANVNGQPNPMTIRRFSPASVALDSFTQSTAHDGTQDLSTGIAVSSVTAGGEPALYVSNSRYANSFVRAYSPTPDPAIVGPPPPIEPTVADSFAKLVGTGDANLAAAINPHFWPDATYHLEYGPADCASSVCVSQPVPDAGLTNQVTDAPVPVEVAVSGLVPGATYHYRFVARSSGGGPAVGPDRTFTTYPPAPAPRTDCGNQAFRTGPSAALPDCRAYELVSPADKNGADARGYVGPLSGGDNPTYAFDNEAAHFQATPDGQKLSYNSATPFADAHAAPNSTQYIASRSAAGWSSHALNPPTSTLISGDQTVATDNFFDAYTTDLSTAWLATFTDPPPDPAGLPGYKNLYRRDNASDAFTALTTVTPPAAHPGFPSNGSQFDPLLGGFSADGSVSVYAANDRLAAGASTATDHGPPIYQLYEARDGASLRLVSRLPGGAASNQPSFVGGGRGHLTGAVSADGSRIYWTTGTFSLDVGALIGGNVYVRVDGTTTIPVSETVSPARARFWVAARDGSAALFSIADQNSPLDGNLYRFDLASQTSTLIATGVGRQESAQEFTVGVIGGSLDLSRFYFTSTDVLDPTTNAFGDTARSGAQNLYSYEQGQSVSFIARASAGIGAPFSLVSVRPGVPVHVTPDGRHLLFVSQRPLTGDDNTDAVAGGPDLEIFRYDADTDRLDCVSCNPSGARPRGRQTLDAQNAVVAAAVLPGTRQGPFYTQRAITDDGDRVYFQSFDALLPQDTNGEADVYQWQAAGSGGCTTAGADYFATDGGCLSLISTGTDPDDSEFIDATPDGSTVFLRTRQRLVGRDTDNLLDIYAARTGGGFALPPASAADCSGQDCQGTASTPPGAPLVASVAFTGAGNPAPEHTSAKVKLSGPKAVRSSRFSVSVKTGSGGLIAGSGRHLTAERKRVGKAGTYTLTFRLTGEGLALLNKQHKLKLVLRVRFTPATGAASVASLRLTLEQPKAKRSDARRARSGRGGAR